MAESSKRINRLRVVQNVLHNVRHSADARHEPVAGVGLTSELRALREWQAARIARTYQDFAKQPQYAPVLAFFLDDLYGPRDYSQRDHDALRVHKFLSKFVPAEMLQLSTDAIELTRTSYTLDEALLGALATLPGSPADITGPRYAEAYRRCDNYPERIRQIDLLARVMADAAVTAHFRLTGPVLRMTHGPAHAAGWQEMFAFLERGYHAFAKVRDPALFLEAIRTRELELLERIRAGESDPFSVP